MTHFGALGLTRDVQGFDPARSPCVLPSGKAACDLLQGNMSALAPAIMWTGIRACAVAVGLYVVGEREHLAKKAVAGALAVEAAVLVHLWVRMQRGATSSRST